MVIHFKSLNPCTCTQFLVFVMAIHFKSLNPCTCTQFLVFVMAIHFKSLNPCTCTQFLVFVMAIHFKSLNPCTCTQFLVFVMVIHFKSLNPCTCTQFLVFVMAIHFKSLNPCTCTQLVFSKNTDLIRPSKKTCLASGFLKKRKEEGLFIFYFLFSRWPPFFLKFQISIVFLLFKHTIHKRNMLDKTLNIYTVVLFGFCQRNC